MNGLIEPRAQANRQNAQPAHSNKAIASANAEVPANWAPQRTRPLCPYPQVAVYTGGDTEQAGSFACKAP